MKTNRIILLASVLCFSLLGTGCGEPLYEMTSEEEAIITLYASKAVAKYNKNQVIGIANARVKKGELDEEYEPDEEAEAGEDDADSVEGDNTEETIDPETGEPIVSEETSDESSQTEAQPEDGANASGETSEDAGYSFTDAIGVEGVNFTCRQFDVSNDFKTSSFYMKPTSGKKYLALYIDAENTSGATVDFSSYKNREYYLSVNGGEKSKAQTTLLGNDLTSFRGKLGASEKKSFMIVFSFSDSAVENISSVELFVTSDGSTRGAEVKPL